MSKYCVSVEFDNMNVAIKAAELLSTAFPMLTFQFSELPEIDIEVLKENLACGATSFLGSPSVPCSTVATSTSYPIQKDDPSLLPPFRAC